MITTDNVGNGFSSTPVTVTVVNTPPTVTGVSPATGSTAGGTSVTVTGTGFLSATGVEFGGTAGTGLTVNNDTSLTITSPAGSGTVDVTVTNIAGSSATGAADLFGYITAPAFTSAASTEFSVGSAGNFTVTTSGVPMVSSITNADFGVCTVSALPGGVTFHDNGDGTATIAGTPAPGTTGTYTLCLTATNGIAPDATQTFTLTVNQAPAITSVDHATFAVGSAGSFTVTTTGVPPVSTIANTDFGVCTVSVLPVGVTFLDNGDGTATISGTPLTGAGGTYTLCLKAANGVIPPATQTFTLTVNEAPAITSAVHATFTVGASGSFTVTATGYPTPTFSETGSLPSGVTLLTNGTLSGTPDTGTAGSYPITITASNGVLPDDHQSFTLTVSGALDHFVLSAATTTPTAGAADNLTITAKDSSNITVTSYTGSHNLTFGGASTIGSYNPTVTNSSDTAIDFGSTTAVTFTNGVATVTGSSNGAMKLYKAESPTVTVSDGTHNGSLALTVGSAPVSQFALTPTTSTPTAGVAFNVAIAALDLYGNAATSYTGAKTIVWSGPHSSPGPVVTAPSYPSTATALTFSGAGTATATNIKLYDAESVTLTATQGTTSGAAALTVGSAPVSQFALTPTTSTPTAGVAFNVAIAALDLYGNAATSYTGAKTIVWSGPA